MLKPLVVSWGYESEFPGVSKFIDHHEWWGTRDMAAFLSVPKAIQFQKEKDWDEVRESCHELATHAQKQICELTSIAPLHPQTGHWYRQMVSAPLPADTDVALLKNRLYDEYKIEIPVFEWRPTLRPEGEQTTTPSTTTGIKLIRVSIQGYNTRRDVDSLISALSNLLKPI
jgi:isopenicillin-N epimerase